MAGAQDVIDVAAELAEGGLVKDVRRRVWPVEGQYADMIVRNMAANEFRHILRFPGYLRGGLGARHNFQFRCLGCHKDLHAFKPDGTALTTADTKRDER